MNSQKLSKILYSDGTKQYRDKDGFTHLVIDDVDVLNNKKAINCIYFGNGSYEYSIIREDK